MEEGETSIRVFDRCRPAVEIMLSVIRTQLSYAGDMEELMCDLQERWISCFADIYENDKQYMRYMFKVMKNRVKDLKRLRYRYDRVHVTDPRYYFAHDEGSRDLSGVKPLNEIAVDYRETNPLITVMQRELIAIIENKLSKDFHKEIFKRMVTGLPHKDIAAQLGCSTCHVVKIKHEKIWPIVKEVMTIPDKKYEVLISSGRIYCP